MSGCGSEPACGPSVGGGGGGLSDAPQCSLTDLAGLTPLPIGVTTPIPWDTQRSIDAAAYTHVPPSSDVTIVESGRYTVGFNVTPVMTVGTGTLSQTDVLHGLFRQIGGAGPFLAVPGTTVASRHFSETFGTASATMGPIQMDLIAGDVIRVSSTKVAGVLSTIVTLPSGSNLTLRREA